MDDVTKARRAVVESRGSWTHFDAALSALIAAARADGRREGIAAAAKAVERADYRAAELHEYAEITVATLRRVAAAREDGARRMREACAAKCREAGGVLVVSGIRSLSPAEVCRGER